MRSLIRSSLLLCAVGLLPACVKPPTVCPDRPVAYLPPPGAVAVKQVVEGLTSPIAMVPANDNSGRWFIIDQIGLIRTVSPNGELMTEPFLDLRNRIVPLNSNYDERGLLGMAFHPDYAENGRLFVRYSAPRNPTTPQDYDHVERLAEFHVSQSNPDQVDVNSEQILLDIDHPQSNHNAGTVAFGPDGMLYMSMGDGGGANDVGLGHADIGNGQSIDRLLGKMLRIDVDAGKPYAIPPDNPFANGPGRPEIYAYGFRNPYRFSFDMRGTHDLLLGDVGQDLWEEVDRVQLGKNYGWRLKEGTHCFDPNNPRNPPATCSDFGLRGERLIDPVIEYANSSQPGGLSLATIGGHVYRGAMMPRYYGRYIFGGLSRSEDKPDGSLFLAVQRAFGMWPMLELRITNTENGRLDHYVKGIGQDQNGEMYVLTSDVLGPTGNTGKVYMLVPCAPDLASPGTEQPSAQPGGGHGY